MATQDWCCNQEPKALKERHVRKGPECLLCAMRLLQLDIRVDFPTGAQGRVELQEGAAGETVWPGVGPRWNRLPGRREADRP